MRLILRFALVAAVVGAALGLLLRRVVGRRCFGLLCTLSLAPVFAHALYLGWISWAAGATTPALAAFGLATATLLVVVGVLGRRWVTRQPWLAALTPLFAGVSYAVVASLLWSFGLGDIDVAPNALAATATGLVCISFVAALLVFVPQPAGQAGTPRFPWQRP